jgi:hypothetical protein
MKSLRRRVLIVVSAYHPAVVADMHRARMLAWELPGAGWDVEVLTPAASEIRADVIEPESTPFFPPTIPVHEVGSTAREFFEWLGSRTHAWRTLWPVYQRGCELLRTGRFDLVYISTATFVYFALGSHWRRKFGVPYVLDFHDPWVKEVRTEATVGRGWRGQLLRQIEHRLERSAVRAAAGLVAVSPHYVEALSARYASLSPPWLARGRHEVIPFGAMERDFDEARRCARPVHLDPTETKTIALIYVGAGGTLMARSFRLICCTLASLRHAGNPLVNRVRISLFGTMYGWQEGSPKILYDIAARESVRELVHESPQRVSYRAGLEILLAADGALILGVDDAGYMPSKLFSYALSGKPLLAALRRESPAYAHMQRSALGHVLWFDGGSDMPAREAGAIVGAFLEEAAARKSFNRIPALGPNLAPAMAARHAELFNASIGPTLPGQE